MQTYFDSLDYGYRYRHYEYRPPGPIEGFVASFIILALPQLALTETIAREINFATKLDNSRLTQRIVNIAASIFAFCIIRASLSAMNRFSSADFSTKPLNYCLPLSLLYQEVCRSSPIDDLHKAIENKDERKIGDLIQRGVDIHAVDDRGLSPLFKALQMQNLNLVHLLTENKADINALDDRGLSPLSKAVQMGNVKIAKFLIKRGANEISFSQALDEAAKRGNAILMKSLLEWKVSRVQTQWIVYQVKEKWNWIDASWCPSTQQLHRAIENGHTEKVDCLIYKGADLNALDGEGLSPLSKAAQTGNLEIAQLLIQNGANINALHLSREQKNLFIRLSAQSMHIDLFQQSHFNLTDKETTYSPFPLTQAVRAGHLKIVELFMQNGANEISLNQALDEAAKTGNITLVQSILKWRIDKGDTDWKRIDLNWCPLEAAVRAEQLHIVQYLIDQGAVINTVERCRILREPFLNVAVKLKNYDLVNCLIKNGADVNQQFKHWNHHLSGSPLEKACGLGKKHGLDIAVLLMENGAKSSTISLEYLKNQQLQYATTKLLISQWKLLYPYGITDEKIVEILPQHLPPITQDKKEITVVIEGKPAEYPLSFLVQIPYFEPFINGRWTENLKESNQLQFNKAPSFEDHHGNHLICNHETLRTLQKELASPEALWEKNLEAFSPLGVGILPLLDYPKQLNALKNILKIQAQLLENRGAQLREFTGLSSPETPFEEEMPAILEIQESLPIECTIHYQSNDVLGAIDQTVRELDRFIEETSGWNRTFYCNKFIFDFVQFLEANELAILSKEKIQPTTQSFSPEEKQVPSFERKGPDHIIDELLIVLKKCPKLAEFLTILELPSSATFQGPGLADLLRSLPNLLYLGIMVGKGERIKIEPFLLEKKAQNERDSKLRILKIDGQEFTFAEKETLKRLFPNVDLLDIQIVNWYYQKSPVFK